MTQERLEQLGQEWQERLRIAHWDVTYTAVPARYVNDDAGLSDCEWFAKSLTAAVRVATEHPEPEIESNLIHELLHLVVAPLAHTSDEIAKQFGAEAQRLADAVVRLETERVVRSLERVIFAEILKERSE